MPSIIGKPAVHLLSSQACLRCQFFLPRPKTTTLELQGLTEVSGAANIHVGNWVQPSLTPVMMADILISELVQRKTEHLLSMC